MLILVSTRENGEITLFRKSEYRHHLILLQITNVAHAS